MNPISVVLTLYPNSPFGLMLMKYLDCQKILKLPRALILLSPWIDMALDHVLHLSKGRLRPNAEVDVVVTSYVENLRFLGHHPVGSLTSPYFSANLAPPGSYVNYPITYLSIGDCETFLPESLQLIDLMRGDGVDVTFDCQKMLFTISSPRLPYPFLLALPRIVYWRTWRTG
uniref:Uncharacterized protein n=1 Tax=Psilocybe cubensis TaxID=181762 RepID=A0A8H7Y075_PSICU